MRCLHENFAGEKKKHMAVCQKPCTPGEHQNSWDLWMFIPLKMVLIGIDPYPYSFIHKLHG